MSSQLGMNRQCLTAGLHDAAFTLADAVYTGTRLARALEKVFAAMAAHAVHLQLQCGALGTEEAMLLGGSSGGQAAQRGDGQEASIPAAASAAAWRQLKKHLQRSVSALAVAGEEAVYGAACKLLTEGRTCVQV